MVSRRQVLSTSSLAVVGSAGCLGTPAGGASDTRTPTLQGTTETDSAEPSDSTGSSDLRIGVSNGTEEVDLVTGDDVATVGAVERARKSGYRVPVTLTDEGTRAFGRGLDRIGAFEDPSAHEIRVFLDGERVTAATLGKDVAADIEAGEWDGRFLVRVSEREEARRLRAALVEG